MTGAVQTGEWAQSRFYK